MEPGERHPADHLGDPHGRPSPSSLSGTWGAPVRRNVRPNCRSSASDLPAGSMTSKFTPSRRTARATPSGSVAVAARMPSNRHALQTATDASSVKSSAPRCGASTIHRAVASSDDATSDQSSSSQTRRKCREYARIDLDREAPFPPLPDAIGLDVRHPPQRDAAPLQEVAGQRGHHRPGSDPDLARPPWQRFGMSQRQELIGEDLGLQAPGPRPTPQLRQDRPDGVIDFSDPCCVLRGECRVLSSVES